MALSELAPSEEIFRKCDVKRFARVEQLVFRLYVGASFFIMCEEPAELFLVYRPGAFRGDKSFLACLHVRELGHRVERESQLGGIHYMEDEDVMSLELEMLQRRKHLVGIVHEIADEQDHAPALDSIRQFVQRAREACIAAGLEVFQLCQHVGQMALPEPGGKHRADLRIEYHQSGGIALAHHEICEARGYAASIFELAHPVRIGLVSHRCGSVQQDVAGEVRLLFELLHIVAVALAEDFPVDVLDVVAGRILAVLGELHGKSAERTSVETQYETLYNGLRQKLHVVDVGENIEIKMSALTHLFSFAISANSNLLYFR